MQQAQFLGSRSQTGFTLVEISVVLVIIGLLLGGVLKGGEIIDNTKVKNVYNTYRELTAEPLATKTVMVQSPVMTIVLPLAVCRQARRLSPTVTAKATLMAVLSTARTVILRTRPARRCISCVSVAL